MVKLGQVAQLVDDEVVLHVAGEEEDFIVEVEVPPLRAAPPAALTILNKHFFPTKAVKGIEVTEPRVHQHTRGLFVFLVVMFVAPMQHEPILPYTKNPRIAAGIFFGVP